MNFISSESLLRFVASVIVVIFISGVLLLSAIDSCRGRKSQQEMTKAAGVYWDNQLKEHCMPQEWRGRAR